MSDTPRTDAVWELFATDTTLEPDVEFSGLARQLERELNAANERIRLLISERDTAQTYADQKWKLRREFHDLFGTDDVEQAVAVVRDMKDRIKRLEEALDLVRPHCSFVHHSKKHQHQYGEPCPVVALIENAKEAKL